MFRCPVCPHHCYMKEGTIGRCGAREGQRGESVCINYAEITSYGLDPIEKKPLARFQPGSMILSVGRFGCNLDCPFCQNWSIAHPKGRPNAVSLFPEALVERAVAEKQYGNIGIAFTYNEPLISYEYVRDTAKLAREQGLANVVVSNGYTEDFVLDQILPLVDAWNIDLKGDDEFYHKMGGSLAPVLHTIERASRVSHVEVTTLIIPGQNDDPGEMREVFRTLGAIDSRIVLHLSRFFPARHWMHLPPTPVHTLEQMKEIAQEYLHTVLLGNV